MQKIVLATSNPHKVEEINAITKDLGVEFVMPPEGFDPVEDGETFEDNSLIKAKEANKLTGMPSLADDSGLCVDALDGGPGVFSARYAPTQKEKIEKLLDELKDVPFEKRGAKFVCAMVLVDKDGKVLFSDRGECHGKIGLTPKGTNGFGYDPVFVVGGKCFDTCAGVHDCSNNDLAMAELSEEEKNKISHRARALQKLIRFLKNKA